MPRQKKKPSYLHHKASGQAYSRLNEKVVYLGRFGSPESRDEYEKVVAAWLDAQPADAITLTLDDLALKYLQHCETYYVKDGEPTSEVGKTRDGLKVAIRIAGKDRVRDFGPQKLIALHSQALIYLQVGSDQEGCAQYDCKNL